MNVNTASYFAKQRNNIVQSRLAAGKFPAYSGVDVLMVGGSKSYDFSEMKANNSDGVTVGHIINTGPGEITIKFNLRKDGVTNSPEINIKNLEKFDIGLFHGRVYSMEIENVSPSTSTMVEIFGV